MDVLAASLLDAGLWILLGGGVLATLAGFWLVIAPHGFSSFSRVVNRWVSTGQATQWLETPRPIERFFYRRHSVFGVLLIIGAAFALCYLGSEIDAVGALAGFVLPWAGPAGDVIAAALTAFLLLGNILVVLLGGIVLVRPSLLKGVERASNRWVSTQEALKGLDSPNELPDQAIARQPRLAGFVLILVGSYTSLQLGLFLV